MGSIFGISINNLVQNTIKKPITQKTYQAQFSEYNYSTASTHDWSKVKNFSSDLFVMQSAGKMPNLENFNNYNGFESLLINPDFNMPTAKL